MKGHRLFLCLQWHHRRTPVAAYIHKSLWGDVWCSGCSTAALYRPPYSVEGRWIASHIPTNSNLLNVNGSIEEGNTEFILSLPCAKVDEITLSPSLGSKNQVLITVNQTLQIIEECGKGLTLDECTPTAFWLYSMHVEGAFKVLSAFSLRLKFQSISKLLTSPNRKILLLECKRGERAVRWQGEHRSAAHGIIMICSFMHRVKQPLSP